MEKSVQQPSVKLPDSAFVFDEDSMKTLQALQKDLGLNSIAEVLGCAMRLTFTLTSEAQAGFSTLLVKNEKNGQSREVVSPFTARAHKRLAKQRSV